MTSLEDAVGSSMMPIQNNLVPVLPTVLLDPALKLRLSRGRWTPESVARGGSAFIKLSYDPQLRPDQLTMPIPSDEIKLLKMLGGAINRDWTAFESPESQTIAEIFVDIHDDGDEVRLVFAPPTPSIEADAKIICNSGVPDVCDRPYDTLAYMFDSIIWMDVWAAEYALPWKKSEISFYVSSNIARELSIRTGRRFDEAEEPLVRFASREVRA